MISVIVSFSRFLLFALQEFFAALLFDFAFVYVASIRIVVIFYGSLEFAIILCSPFCVTGSPLNFSLSIRNFCNCLADNWQHLYNIKESEILDGLL